VVAAVCGKGYVYALNRGMTGSCDSGLNLVCRGTGNASSQFPARVNKSGLTSVLDRVNCGVIRAFSIPEVKRATLSRRNLNPEASIGGLAP
jgi:hypothetical protein